MQRSSFAGMPCSIARALDAVGEWWTLLIIRDVFNGIRRFDDLLRDLGISRNVLTSRLNSLVERGILRRRLYQARPPRYEYRLTEMGLDLLPVLLSLMHWGDRWLADASGPPVTLVHRDCGQPATPQLNCSVCHAPLVPGSLELRPGPQPAEQAG